MSMLTRRQFISGSATALTAACLRAAPAGAPVRPPRIALLGVAHSHAIGKWAALSRMGPRIERVAIWEPDPQLREKAGHEPVYQGCTWLADFNELRERAIDAVLVERELPDMLATARHALDSGWHVHLEKPPGSDLKAFHELQQEAGRSGRVLQLGYMLRYNAGVRWAFDAVRRGLIGRVFAIHGEMGRLQPLSERAVVAPIYSGAMMYVGSHLLDLAVGLLGRPVRCTRYSQNTYPERDNFMDRELYVLEYASALVTIRSMLVESEGSSHRRFVVYGEKGTVEVTPLGPPTVYLSLNAAAGEFRAGTQSVPLGKPEGPFDAMLGDFVGMVEGRPPDLPAFDAAHDYLVQEVLLNASELRSR